MSVQVVSHSLSTGSIDRTPCSLISNTRGPDDEGCEDETRRSSAKMGAIDDAGRRPSLPINIYTLDRHGADNLSNPSTRSSEEASGSESDPTASGNASGAYLDRRRRQVKALASFQPTEDSADERARARPNDSTVTERWRIYVNIRFGVALNLADWMNAARGTINTVIVVFLAVVIGCTGFVAVSPFFSLYALL
jgi:hypothetical protein